MRLCCRDVTTGRAKLEKQSHRLRSGSPAVLTPLDFCFSLAEKRIFGLQHLPINNGVIQTSCAAFSFLPAASAGKGGQGASGCFPFSKNNKGLQVVAWVWSERKYWELWQEAISCHDDTVFFHPNAQRFWTSLTNNTVLPDFSSTICDLIQKFTSCSPLRNSPFFATGSAEATLWRGIKGFNWRKSRRHRWSFQNVSRLVWSNDSSVLWQTPPIPQRNMSRLESLLPHPHPPPTKKPRLTSLVETKTQVPYKHNRREELPNTV